MDSEWTRNATSFAKTPNGLDDTFDPELDDYLPESDAFENPYELMVAPLGGLDWIMSLVRNTEDADIVNFGAALLFRAVGTHVPAKDALDHPGVASGLVDALCTAAASEELEMVPLWIAVDRFIAADPEYWRDIASSEFLTNIAMYASLLSPDYDMDGAAMAVTGLHKHAIVTTTIAPHLALDFANAGIALCQHPHTYQVHVIGVTFRHHCNDCWRGTVVRGRI
ncbi:hypothetical protein BC828DRAFT_395062 [Blastocladiella britannica]|nr:hypothetical protein BC828DRAFT_395062 [Blastocladiella britannica]